MKKSTLFSLIAVGVGIILIGLSILLVGGNFRKFGAKKAGAGQNYIYHKYECTSDITALDVKELYETAVITTGSVDKPVVEYSTLSTRKPASSALPREIGRAHV